MDVLQISSTSSEESSEKDKPVLAVPDKQLLCSFPGCSKQFAKNRKLINHLRFHQNDRPFVCDVPNCHKKYTNSSHLRRHKITRHADKKEHIMCTVDGCNRELANRCSLKKHILRCHNPQRVYPFTCTQCQQGFYRKKQLQQHSYLHTGELPFSCDECKAMFLTSNERNRHKRIHKKYTCDCGEVCRTWHIFLTHKKICKQTRFKCFTCEKEFTNKMNLKIHQSTHVNKDDRNIFLCPYDDCSRHYHYKTNLTHHINNFHKKISRPKIPCKYEGCNQLLSKMQNYKVHLRTHEETTRPRFPRKPRKDKNIPKQTFLEKLCGISACDMEEIKNQPQQNCEVKSS